jgi:hypothetical protein
VYGNHAELPSLECGRAQSAANRLTKATKRAATHQKTKVFLLLFFQKKKILLFLKKKKQKDFYVLAAS